MRLKKIRLKRMFALVLAAALSFSVLPTDMLGGILEVKAANQSIVLFDDAEATGITVKEGYTVSDGAIKGTGGWTWINLKYGEAQNWSDAAKNGGVLRFDAKSGWWNNTTAKVRLYVGDSYTELTDVALPTETGKWHKVEIALSRFMGADFTQVKGIGIMTYASDQSNWVDNICVEWTDSSPEVVNKDIVLFDNAEAPDITVKEGYAISDGAIKGTGGWTWINLKYGETQNWSDAAKNGGILRFDAKSGWWNSTTAKVRLYVGDSYAELTDVALPTQTGVWGEVEVALSRFAGADFTQVKGIGIMTYASENSNWIDNIRVEWTEVTNTIAITAQPVATTNIEVNKTVALTVSAIVSGESVETYQWYQCDDVSKTNPVAIDEATAATYTVPTTTEGTYYYFCRVSAVGAVDVDSEVSTVIVEKSTEKTVLFDDKEASGITVKEGYTISDGAIKGTGGWTWINLKYGEAQNWSNAAENGGVLRFDAKSGWWNNTTAKVRLYVGDSYVELADVALPTQIGVWGEVEVALSRFAGADFTQVKGIGIMTYASENSNWIDNIRIEWQTTLKPVISITKQPSNTTVDVGYEAKVMVEASITNGGTLNYQWYQCDDEEKTNAVAIEGATEANYSVPNTTAIGKYFYFCEVSFEGADKKETNVVRVTIQQPSTVKQIYLFKDSFSSDITQTENCSISNGTLLATAGWGWLNIKYGAGQDWSEAAKNNGSLAFGLKSGWLSSNDSMKIRIYTNGGSFDVTYKVTDLNIWNEISIPLNDFGVTDFTKVGGIGVMTYGSNTTTFLDNIRIEWEEMENTINVTSQPSSKILVQKDAKASLKVKATVSNNTKPDYQWFRCLSEDRADAQRIEGATKDTFEIPNTGVKGVYYYYCQLAAKGAATLNTRVATVIVGTYSDAYTNAENYATDSKFRPIFGDDYILSTGSELKKESDATGTYLVAGKNQSGNYSQEFRLEAGAFNSKSYSASYSTKSASKRGDYAVRFRVRFPQKAQTDVLYRVSLVNPALKGKEEWRTISCTVDISSYIDMNSKDWQEIVVPLSEFKEKASYWDPKDANADKWGGVAVTFDYTNIVGIQFSQTIPKGVTKDESKVMHIDSVCFSKAAPTSEKPAPKKEALTTDRWIFNDAIVGDNKITSGKNGFTIQAGGAIRGTHTLAMETEKDVNVTASIKLIPKMTLNSEQQNSAALRFWIKLPGEGAYNVSLCNDYNHVEEWATANTTVSLGTYISAKRTEWQEVIIPLSDFTKDAKYWSNSKRKLVDCTFDFDDIYAISISCLSKQGGTILVDDIYFDYGFVIDNNGNTEDLQKGASVLQMIYGDSFGKNKMVKGFFNYRIGYKDAKVGKAKLEITHPWDNTEWYAIFPEAIDLSDKEVYESAAVEFWVKLHGEISWYNFYLFNQRGEGETDLGRTSVSINDFIDKKKIGEWQKVQIPLTNFTTDGRYVDENLQLQDWEFDFSKVVGAGTAQMAAKGAPTDPLVEYDDVKITIGNLPDQNFGVKIISQKEFDAKNIKFTKLDLTSCMTTGFADEEAGDGKGGWTDQGATNDLSSFELRGEQYFESIPFDIVEPNDNNGKSAIALRQFFGGVFTEEVEIPVGQKAAGFYVVHAYSYDDNHIATYTYEYADGTKADVKIMKNQQIYNWWGTKESDVVRVIWTGENPEASTFNLQISLNMFPCVNPNPEKEIKSIRLKSETEDCAAMIVAMTLADQGLYLPEAKSIYNPDTSDWYAYEQPDYKKLMGTALDVSYVLDAPAGKHGYVTADGEEFVFEDGTVAQFWGTNNGETATFQSHEKIDQYVDVLAASGMNMVRLMDIDGGYFQPNVFGFNKDSMTVDTEAMDRLCYFWAKCKEKGIYIQYCLVGVRYPSTAMNHPAYEDLAVGFKTEIYFDEQLQDLTKELEKTILTWKNPYTGTTLATDPCVAMFEINNESNLINTFGTYSGQNYEISSDYEKNLFRKLFNEYLKELYGTNEQLVKAWTSDGKIALRDGENLDNGTVVLDEQYLQSDFSRKRMNDSFAFLYKLQKEYHEGMIQWLKEELGVKAPVTGTTNLPSNDRADIYENAQYDYLARHQYQSHPQSGTEYKVGAYTGGVDSIILNPAKSALSEDASRRVTGVPYIVNEFQQCEPNIYISEFYLVSSAIFSYQGWSGLNFPFKVGEMTETSKNKISDFFQVMGHPLRFGTIASSSLLYHRNEIGGAKDGYYTNYTEKDALNAKNQSTGLPDYSYIVGRAGINMKEATGASEESSMTILEKASHQNLVNEGGELIWTPSVGHFLVNTSQTQAAAGTITGKKISLDDVEIYTDNYFANITVSALGMEDKIADADNILITAAARARNTGAKLSKDGKKIEAKGEAPILVEQVEGTVTIKNTGDYDVYILNSSGERVGKANQYKDERGYTVVEMKLGDKSMHYELVKVKDGEKTEKSIFSDVSDDMASLIESGAEWIPSLTETIFGINYDIERGNFVAALVRAFELSGGDNSDKYGDVEDTHQGAEELKTAKALKLVSGIKLDPYASMSRADAWVALYNAMTCAGIELKDNTEALKMVENYETLTEEQQKAAGALISAGYITVEEDKKIDALEYVSRGEAVNLICSAKELTNATNNFVKIATTVGATVAIIAIAVAAVVIARRKRKRSIQEDKA